MTTYYTSEQTVVNGPNSGQPLRNRLKSNKFGGRIRFAEFVFVVPAGTLQIADKIVWGKLPVKSRILGHMSRLVFTAGTASSTINLGDNVVPARHLAATSVASAGSAVPTAAEQALTSVGNTSNGSAVVTITASLGAPQVGSLATGTGIPASTTVLSVTQASTGQLSVTLSNAATATNLGTALTFTGSAYETQDDSSNVQNNFGSTTDDCSITSVVAGAVLAADQVITLKLAYVND